MNGSPSHIPAASWFPIPMRGNERFIGTSPVGMNATFPIPMRGNEIVYDAGTVQSTLAFPIPMRGNDASLRPLRAPTHRVSDPHEGY